MTLTLGLAAVLVGFVAFAAKHRPKPPIVTDQCTPFGVLRDRQRLARMAADRAGVQPCWSGFSPLQPLPRTVALSMPDPKRRAHLEALNRTRVAAGLAPVKGTVIESGRIQ